MKVLIVDDSPATLRVARARLKKERLDIVCASSGRKGLQIAKIEAPDLVMLDIDMPGMSGFDLCRKLKSDPQTNLIPVIFLSGSTSADDKVKGLDLGAIDYVTKPFDPFELRARVRAALRTKRLQDMLAAEASIDPLTGLANRRAFDNRLNEEWARRSRHGSDLALIMADIDLFKDVNDTYGHGVGDVVLHHVADILRAECRKYDTPARYGGEEFAVICAKENAEGAAALAQRLREMLKKIPCNTDKGMIEITMSFGIADALMCDSPKALVESADKAVYAAKEAGRNRVEVACYSVSVA